MLAFQTRSYLVSWSQGIFAVGSNRSCYSRQKTNNKSDSDCNIGIQVRTRSHTSWQTAEVPLHVCGKCEKCMAGKFCVTSNTMTHFFFFFFGDCAALLPPCQCMLLSTAITRGITVHFVNNGSTRFVFFWAFQHGRRWSTYSRTQIILNRQYKQWFDFLYIWICLNNTTVRATPQEICSAQIGFGCESEEQEKCSISSHKHFKTVNSVEEPMCRTAGPDMQRSLCWVLLG